MEMQNERHLPLARDAVWRALNDPEVLRACVPGCESFERVDDNSYDAVVTAKVGPVQARFKGRVTLEDLQPPESYSMSFQGQGGQAGFVRGTADVRLDETADGCRVGYGVRATLGGKLAQLGSRLVDGAARKTADDFFDNFVEYMAPATGEAAARGRRLWPWAVAAGVIVLLALALALL